MKLHILGVCGTFMAGIAVLARQSGHEVTGSDQNIYPPMSSQLESQGISLSNGYDAETLPENTDLVIVGNVIKRGMPVMEHILNQNIPYISGPQWLAEHVLHHRHVLAVSGTHGKTTTTSLLTWILDQANLKPGFLIGGIPENFGVSARMGESPFFVIEADEYDSAFFDKRSKFIHYHPKTLVLNNLEFDHADIFKDLESIKQQFHFLIRTVPGNGKLIINANDKNLQDVLTRGCWSQQTTFGKEAHWQAQLLNEAGNEFIVVFKGKNIGKINWSLLGHHNVMNALAALAAAENIGVNPEQALAALTTFKNVKRRLEIKGAVNGITIYDDFAHHPTAIQTTLAGLRAKIGQSRIVAILEFGSYTMRSGVHKNQMKEALATADIVLCKTPESTDWELAEILKEFSQPATLHSSAENIIQYLTPQLKSGDHVVIMSNSSFNGIHYQLLKELSL